MTETPNVHLYVETNWVLNLVLSQDPKAGDLLQLAREGKIKLHLPQLCIAEAYSTLSGKTKAKRELLRAIQRWAHELSRSSLDLYQRTFRQLQEVQIHLAEITDTETNHLEQTLAELLKVVNLLSFDPPTYEKALLLQNQYPDVQALDAIILACLVVHADSLEPSIPKCFFTTNSEDFNEKMLQPELAPRNIKPLYNGEDCFRYIMQQLKD